MLKWAIMQGSMGADKSFSVAPMLAVTDRHCRAFLRLFSLHFRLYTEMTAADSIIHGDRDGLLGFNRIEHPVALQLGGCDPDKLRLCSKLGEDRGYDEINLNVGCPSSRVKNARFGACLMAHPHLVAECVGAMAVSVSIPVSVKTRIGIDDHDSYEQLTAFVKTVSEAGCRRFIIHARKAWLKGLSPKENRTLPPLRYDIVYKIKRDFPQLNIVVNGGISNIAEIQKHLSRTDGVMMGRQVYRNPWMLKEIEHRFFAGTADCRQNHGVRSRGDHVRLFFPYIEEQLSRGVCLRHITRHMLGLFHGRPGARGWRRYLSACGPRKSAGVEVVEEALKFVEDNDRTMTECGGSGAHWQRNHQY